LVFSESLSELREIFSGNVGVMALSWFLFGLSSSLVIPFFFLYAKALGASDLIIAYIRSIGLYALAGSIVFGGLLTDYIGRVKTILIGTSIIVITQYAYAFVNDWFQLAIIWVIDEVAHFYQPALSAIIMDSLPRDKTLKGFLLLQAIPSIPGLFMPIIGGILYDIYGLTGVRLGFIISGTISLIVLLLRMKGLRETITINKRVRVSNFILELRNYRVELKNALKIFIYSGFLFQLGVAVWFTYGSIYVVEVLGSTKTEWGLLNSLITATMILVSLIFGFSTRLDGFKIALIGGLSITISQLMIAIPGYYGLYDPLIMRSAVIVGAIGNTVIWPLISTLLTKILSPEIRGRVTGFQRMFENIGMATVTILAGYLYTGLGPANSFVFSAFINLFSTIYLLKIYLSIEKN